MNVRKHLLRIIGHSICKDGIKDPYQLTADRNHGLFLLERIIRSCRVILMLHRLKASGHVDAMVAVPNGLVQLIQNRSGSV